MDNRQFDDLARLLATGMSRRQVLQVLLGSAGAGLLALIGFGGGKNKHATAAPAVTPTPAYRVFVPLVQKACTVASTCANKVFCSADQICRCIKSAEGPILCGKVPDCNILHCKTSADCARLGPGYFCDTPNSGCCNDAELQRCIMPCVPPGCPPERICGNDCCPEGQVCVGTSCCPTAQVCGTTCCPTGKDCVNGKCVVTCASDPVTSASLDAALAALAGGSNQVALSPKGCLQYRRSMSGTWVDSEEVWVTGGASVSTWRHFSNLSQGDEDSDMDGYAERRMVVYHGATANDQLIVTDYSPSTHHVIGRTTLTRGVDTIHVMLEEPDASGVLQIVNQYDTDLWEYYVKLESPAANETGAPQRQAATCSQPQCDDLRRRLDEARDMGTHCLFKYKAFALEQRLTNAFYRSYNPKVSCGNPTRKINGVDVPVYARTWPGWTKEGWPVFGHADGMIDVNKDIFCGLSDTEQLATLFHEYMHFDVPVHDPNKEIAPNRRDVDPFYACAQLCFHPESQSTQCTCATCLETTRCDERCDTKYGFQPCQDDDFGTWCECQKKGISVWYPSCTQCLTDCPSGTGCFVGYTCTPDKARRCTPATCP